MRRAHRIHATMHNRQVEHQSTMLETRGKLNNMDVTILIDPSETNSFISPNGLVKCKLVETEQNDFDEVEMALDHSQKVKFLVCKFPLDLGVCITHVNLYVTSLGHYDVIKRMDWLESHWVVLDCRINTLNFVNDQGQLMILQGEKKHVSLRLILAL